MMKYELSQGAYRDFLNTATYTQQNNHFYFSNPPSSPIGTFIHSNTVRQKLGIAVPGIDPGTPAIIGCDADNDNIFNEPGDGEWLPVSNVTWQQNAAYLDWAGLRPMTELEYEKVCRGPLTPVAGEYAWGDSSIANFFYTFTNLNFKNESSSNSSAVFGNAIANGTTAPSVNIIFRGGIFATQISTRISAGAGYYGVMVLTGNLIEYAVTIANIAGRAYNGKHGDGELTVQGNANENNWPGVNGATGSTVAPGIYNGGFGVNSDGGTRQKGGNWSTDNFGIDQSLRISWRFGNANGIIVLSNTSPGSPVSGIRGVRDAN